MSEAIWCDMGDHAFSANDPERHRLSESKMVDSPDSYNGKKEVTTIVDVCGPCWRTRNPFQEPATPSAIPEDESYLRGYREGVIKGETIK